MIELKSYSSNQRRNICKVYYHHKKITTTTSLVQLCSSVVSRSLMKLYHKTC